ncbi:MAG: alanine--tRNA ligase [Clostridia bacterium]|jgi:alanyl-tRNA synthetase|nr:alanine--tRNA ligase [Clostridia bacterium]
MKANELRRKYIDFFVSKGHKEISSASLIPENDPSVLFTTAGMHPLVPYLLGEKHPSGTRLTDHQKCLRTGDIDEVGDASHLTFFEMMGNWSLNDYFKKESIGFSHEFLTKILGIPQEKISVTVFAGDSEVPRDEEAYNAWKSLGYPDERIHFLGRKDNWWGPAGETGPCGPDTEIFYDMGKPKCSDTCGPQCNCGKYVEIWNNVFMEYNKQKDGSYKKMEIHNVDTGLGLERVLCILNGEKSVYDTEIFKPIMDGLKQATGVEITEENLRIFRILADHLRAITFILGDDKGVSPSNVDQGYVLRRLIRRVYRHLKGLCNPDGVMVKISKIIVDEFKGVYPELERNQAFIEKSLQDEERTFSKTLDQGIKIASKFLDGVKEGEMLSGEMAFKLYDTYGFPIELTEELASERGIKVDVDGFKAHYVKHQELSRQGADQKFKGGLSDNSEQTTRLHTATHLLNGALRKVLGDTVFQKGSNITPERLRFDFSFDRKMTPEEIKAVEDIVNQAIKDDIEVVLEEMPVEKAREVGAIGVFGNKYGENVKVYTIEGYSKEICGGPHAKRTSELGSFKIKKEESSSAGVRRIKAVISQ